MCLIILSGDEYTAHTRDVCLFVMIALHRWSLKSEICIFLIQMTFLISPKLPYSVTCMQKCTTAVCFAQKKGFEALTGPLASHGFIS